MDQETSDLLERMDARIRALEDQVALYQALSTYGPAVDSISNAEAADLWVEDGVFDTGGPAPEMNNRSAIRSMFDDWGIHRGLVADGCGHVTSLPLMRVDGDKAIGLGYFRLYLNGPEGVKVWRLSAIRWDWVRTPTRWKAVRQTKRVLDGSDAARVLLRETLQEILQVHPARSAQAAGGSDGEG